MREEELAAQGKDWLRVVALAKDAGILSEIEHVRFRDSDLSIKGGALLGFAGLMLAADLVFLSAGQGSLIMPDRSCVTVGVGSLVVLVGGAFCALISIMISRRGTYHSAWSSFGLMKLYHTRRRRWLAIGGALTVLGTLAYLASILSVVRFGNCALPWA
jgi:hypothetical protein